MSSVEMTLGSDLSNEMMEIWRVEMDVMGLVVWKMGMYVQLLRRAHRIGALGARLGMEVSSTFITPIL